MSNDLADGVEPDLGASPLRVVLDARLEDGRAGGVQMFVIGLAAALMQLNDGTKDYRFLGQRGQAGWLMPFLADDSQLISPALQEGEIVPSPLRRARSAVGRRVPLVRSAWRRIVGARGGGGVALPTSDGTIEAIGADVVHFTFQGAFITETASIYQPWDLQHVYLPEFFTPQECRWREAAYRAFSERAETVVVASRWAKDDVVRHLGIAPSKVAIVEVPPVIDAYPTPDAEMVDLVRRRFELPSRFVYYPAQTWRHKNHERLLEAIALLRDRDGLDVQLVCSGAQNAHFPAIQAAVRRLHLEERIQFLGFVEPIEIQALYRLARGLVFPSLFEGWGLPVVEAFSVGLPVVCSNVTSLPDLVGDAALLFDPLDVDAMAAAISRVWQDDELGELLASRGRGVAARLDWHETAMTYRALYRAAGGRSLSPEDRQLLARSFGVADL